MSDTQATDVDGSGGPVHPDDRTGAPAVQSPDDLGSLAAEVETSPSGTDDLLAGGPAGDRSEQSARHSSDDPAEQSADDFADDFADDSEDDSGDGLVDESADDSAEDSAQATGDAVDASAKGDKKSRVRQLEREGEVAADFLETLLDIADLDGDIDVDVDGDRAAIAIVDSDEGRVPRRLVGADGKVLEALQELTRLAVQVETGERSRLMLDIAGHRAQRRSALVELAHAAIADVKESGTKRALEPMSAFERKVVHDEVSAAGLVSESEGVDPHRHIVILPS
jgi:spoIIIJ-associated protein